MIGIIFLSTYRMHTNPLRISIILGSTRPNRFSDKPGVWIAERLAAHADVAAELLDLREYQMPFFNEPVTPSAKKEDYAHEAVARWTKKIDASDAFVMVTPEYNHGPSGVLKNAIDYVGKEWNNKPVGFVGYGTYGGSRSVEQLRQIAIELQMAPIRAAVHIPLHWTLLDEKGALKPDALAPFEKSADAFIAQLLWWTRALKTARAAR